MTLINVRGTNGSGKSTIVRGLLAKARVRRPIYGVLGIRQPEAYRLMFGDADEPLTVIGPYDRETGGCDSVQPYSLILDLIQKYSMMGAVLFEGVLVSTCWGEIGEELESWGDEAYVLFLDTPVEECIRSTEARRARKGNDKELDPKNLIAHAKAVDRIREKLKGTQVKSGLISRETGVEAITRILAGDDYGDLIRT